jgi:hypothetical protein
VQVVVDITDSGAAGSGASVPLGKFLSFPLSVKIWPGIHTGAAHGAGPGTPAGRWPAAPPSRTRLTGNGHQPVTTLTSSPSARCSRPITSICRSSIDRPRSRRLCRFGAMSPWRTSAGHTDDLAGSGPTPSRPSCQRIRDGPTPAAPAAAPPPVPPPRQASDAARPRPRRLVHHPSQPSISGIPARPQVHSLPRHPISAGHIGHRRLTRQNTSAG